MVNKKKESALMKAASNNHLECIQFLLKEIKMQDKDGWTALMIAAQKGY